MLTQEQLDRIIGSNLIDVNGDRIGNVGHVFLDDRSGQPSWLTVNTGFFGMNETFVPIQGSTPEGDDIRVPFEKAFVKDAPNVDVNDGHLSRDEEAELYRYYGLGYDDPATTGNPTDAPTRDRDALREPGAQDDPDMRPDTMSERDVREPRGEHTGDQDDLIGDDRRARQDETGVRLRKYTVTERQEEHVMPMEGDDSATGTGESAYR